MSALVQATISNLNIINYKSSYQIRVKKLLGRNNPSSFFRFYVVFDMQI